MSDVIEYERPSGSKITLKNTEAMAKYAEQSGWKVVKAKKPKKVAKNDYSITDSERGG
jgi:hypothetical protein